MQRRLLILAAFLIFTILVFSYFRSSEKTKNEIPLQPEITATPIVSISPGSTETDQQLLDMLNQTSDPDFDLQFQKIQSELQ